MLQQGGPPQRAGRIAGTLVCLAAFASFAAAQSLGGAAEKERERRERVRKTGRASPVLTDADLQTTKGQVANEPAADAVPSGGNGESADPGRVVLSVTPPTDSETKVREQKEADWRGRAAAARNRIAEAQARYDAIARMIRVGQPGRYDENGRRVAYSVLQLKQMADQAEAELAAAKKALEDLLDEGRRAGALPGWLR